MTPSLRSSPMLLEASSATTAARRRAMWRVDEAENSRQGVASKIHPLLSRFLGPQGPMLFDENIGRLVEHASKKTFYEEYHPYGTSAYRAFQSSEVSARRYRYTGKERDEETSLYYYGARYYAPWLGRWTAADRAGLVDGPGLYNYVRGSPVTLHDPNGNQGAVVEELHRRPSRAAVESEFKSEGGAAAGGAAGASPAAPKRREITETVRPRTITEEGPSLAEQVGRATGVAIERAGEGLEEKKAPPAIEAFGEHYSGAAKTEEITGVDVAMGVVGLVTAPATAGPSLVIAGVKGAYNIGAGTREVAEAKTSEQSERGWGRVAAGAVDVLMFAWAVQGATSSAAPKTKPATPVSPEVEAAGPSGFSKWTDPSALKGVTGRTAEARRAALDAIIEEDFPSLKFTHKPEYSPHAGYGVAKEGTGTQIGPKAFESRQQLRNTLIHEELHHRWWGRGTRSPHHEAGSAMEARFYNIVVRYMRMRGWQK